MISVIVPVYNVEKYIDECVQSILAQTYTEFELLLIDDGSKDSSGSKCENWAHRDSRIRVIHKENGGLASVRNMGLTLAKGDYIAWIDSDDYVDVDFLRHLYTTLEENQADMVICGFYTDENGTIIHKGKEYFFDAIYNRQEFMERVYTFGMYSIMCNKFLRKSAYEGVEFPEGRIFEDSSVMRKLALSCEKIVVTGRPLYYYRRHATSITLQKKGEQENLYYMRQFCTWLQEDIKVYKQEGNGRLMAYASKHLCDAVIKYSAGLSKKGIAEGRKIYKKYVGNILRSKDIVLKSKIKYTVAKISFSLYRKLFDILQNKKRI